MAVGVFGGLMIIFGTSSSDAASDESQPVVTAQVTDAGAGAMESDPQAGEAQEGETAGGVVAAAVADAAPPAPKSVVLAFDVEPADARITVDGEDVDGDSFTIELDPGQKKRVKVEAKSNGYRSWSRSISVTTDTDEKTVSIDLDKIVRRPAKKERSRRGGHRKKPRGPGGLIDL